MIREKTRHKARTRKLTEFGVALNEEVRTSLQLDVAARLGEQDLRTVSWAFTLWYLMWVDFLAYYEKYFMPVRSIHETPLWEKTLDRGTACRWARILSAPMAQLWLTELDQMDRPLITSTSRNELLRSLRSCINTVGLPCHAQVERSLSHLGVADLETLIQPVRTLVNFMLRIRVEAWADPGVEAWVEHNQQIQEVDPDLLTDLTDVLTSTSRQVKPPSRKKNISLLPSGSVADVKDAYGKPGRKVGCTCTASRESVTHLIRYGITPFYEFEWGNYDRRTVYFDGEPVLADRLLRHTLYQEGEPLSRMHSVPKNWKTDRVIVIEPAFQAIAQAVLGDMLRDRIAQSWHGHCDPADPAWNRWLVKHPDYATIDSSRASDCVTCGLVKAVYGRAWFALLDAARTTAVQIPIDPRDEHTEYYTEHINFYAGMGNGTTFPVECGIFCSIIWYVIVKNDLDRNANWGVFGDDIIIPKAWFPLVCDALQAFGFKVNGEKSFSEPYLFRESCGYDYYRSDLVTPLRLPRKFHELADLLDVVACPNHYNRKNKVVRAYCDRIVRSERKFALTSLQVATFIKGRFCDGLTRVLSDFLHQLGARFSNVIHFLSDSPSWHPVWDRWRYDEWYTKAAFSATAESDVDSSFDIAKQSLVEPQDTKRLCWALQNGGRTYRFTYPVWTGVRDYPENHLIPGCIEEEKYWQHANSPEMRALLKRRERRFCREKGIQRHQDHWIRAGVSPAENLLHPYEGDKGSKGTARTNEFRVSLLIGKTKVRVLHYSCVSNYSIPKQ